MAFRKNKVKNVLLSLACFGVAVGMLALHHPVISGIFVACGFGAWYLAGTTRD